MKNNYDKIESGQSKIFGYLNKNIKFSIKFDTIKRLINKKKKKCKKTF
jgi:hypothetical protein